MACKMRFTGREEIIDQPGTLVIVSKARIFGYWLVVID